MSLIEVSVIIPVYETERFLRECLNSVVRQYSCQIEILAIDDKSPDGCSDILREFASVDDRIRVITHTENRGLSSTRNTGIDEARGRFVFFLDSDDVVPSGALEQLLAVAERDSADIVRGHRPRWRETSDGCVLERFATDQKFFPNYIGNTNVAKYPQLVKSSNSLSSLYRRQFLNQNKVRFVDELRRREDRAFFLMAFLFAENVSILPEPVSYYRLRNNEATGAPSSITQAPQPEDAIYLLRQTEFVHHLWTKGIDKSPFTRAELRCASGLVAADSLKILLTTIYDLAFTLESSIRDDCLTRICGLLKELPTPIDASKLRNAQISPYLLSRMQEAEAAIGGISR